MAWSYSTTLANDTPRDAAKVMVLINEAKNGLETVAGDEIDFLTETGAPITMNATAGHNHNGVNSRAILDPAPLRRGGLLVAQSQNLVKYASWGDTGVSTDFNSGTGITTIVGAQFAWRDPSDPSDGMPTGVGSGWTQRRQGGCGSCGTPEDEYHWLYDGTVSPMRLFVYHRLLEFASAGFAEFHAWIIGY